MRCFKKFQLLALKAPIHYFRWKQTFIDKNTKSIIIPWGIYAFSKQKGIIMQGIINWKITNRFNQPIWHLNVKQKLHFRIFLRNTFHLTVNISFWNRIIMKTITVFIGRKLCHKVISYWTIFALLVSEACNFDCLNWYTPIS